MQNEVAVARQKAEEKRASMEAKRGEKMAKVLEMAKLMKIVGRAPSKRSFFKSSKHEWAWSVSYHDQLKGLVLLQEKFNIEAWNSWVYIRIMLFPLQTVRVETWSSCGMNSEFYIFYYQI